MGSCSQKGYHVRFSWFSGGGSPTGLGHHLLGPSPNRGGDLEPPLDRATVGSEQLQRPQRWVWRAGRTRQCQLPLWLSRVRSVPRCPLPPGRPCLASLPIGRHLQAEAGLHVHELLIVPQPVGHGQGEGRLLILQAGDRALKGTDSHDEVRGRELRWVALKVPTVQGTKGNEKPPAS